MLLNPLFTTVLIVTIFIHLVCGLKWQYNFLKCLTPSGRTIRSLKIYLSIYYPFGSLDHLYDPPSLVLIPTPPACVDSVTLWRLCQEDMEIMVPQLLGFIFFCLFG